MERENKYQMTCLQVHNDYQIAGGETKTAERIADLLESYGIKVIRYYKSNKSFQNAGYIEKVKIGVYSVFNPKTISEVSEIIKKENVDFALIHNVMPIISNSIYQVLIDHNIPVIKYIQNYNLVCLNGALDHGAECERCKKTCWNGVKNACYKDSRIYSFIKYLAKKYMDIKYMSKIDAFMPNSEFVKGKHKEFGIREDRMHVMHNFIDMEDIKLNAENFDSYYLYFGRISREKGVFTAVKAFKKLPQSKLRIMGTGECEEQLKEAIFDFPNIEYVGSKSGKELVDNIKKAKCVIVPSEWDEPLPRTILEAYAYGIPVIGAERGGIPEMIVNGITGYIFSNSVNNLERNIERIRDLSIEEYNRMRLDCIKICRNYYSKDAYYSRFFNCLSYIRVV